MNLAVSKVFWHRSVRDFLPLQFSGQPLIVQLKASVVGGEEEFTTTGHKVTGVFDQVGMISSNRECFPHALGV